MSLAIGVAALAASGGAQAGLCSVHANKHYVFLMQGHFHSAEDSPDALRVWLGQVRFGADGRSGHFRLTSQSGGAGASFSRSGPVSCASDRGLDAGAQRWRLGAEVSLQVMPDAGRLQLLATEARGAMSGEARRGAEVASWFAGACDLLPGHRYAGQVSGYPANVGSVTQVRWDFSSLASTMKRWSASPGADAAERVSWALDQCTAIPGGGARMALERGEQGGVLAYLSADGGLAWVHTGEGPVQAGWMAPQ